jgi:hypothetical protein
MAAESCRVDAEISRKSQSEILRRLASVGQNAVGEALGKSETWISRWKSDDLRSCADLLSVLGLKVVPSENRCYPPEHIAHLEYFARRGMEMQAPTLEWEADRDG